MHYREWKVRKDRDETFPEPNPLANRSVCLILVDSVQVNHPAVSDAYLEEIADRVESGDLTLEEAEQAVENTVALYDLIPEEALT